MKHKHRMKVKLDNDYLTGKVIELIAGTRAQLQTELPKYYHIVSIIERGKVRFDSDEDYRKVGVTIRIKADDDASKEIKAGTLHGLFGGPGGKIGKYLYNLVKWNVIQKVQPAVNMVSAATWRFTDEYEKHPSGFKTFYGNKRSVVDKLSNQWKTRLENPLVADTQYIYDNHVGLSVDGVLYVKEKLNHPNVDVIAEALLNGCFDDNKEALLDLMDGVPVPKEDHALVNLFLKNGQCNRIKNGKRMYHTLAFLKSEYRSYILLNGTPINNHEVDLVNSQPTFACALLKQTWKDSFGNLPINADLVEFERACLENRFYETLADAAAIELTAEIRKQFKKDFFREVFFSREYDPKKKVKVLRRAFVKLYPTALLLMKHLKVRDYRQFAIRCQDLEADLMIYNVYKTLLAEGFACLPLHDAIYCSTAEGEERAKELIQECFNTMHQMQVTFKSDVKCASAL